MKTFIASIVALGVIATPGFAQTNTMSSSAKTTKTMVTKGPKSTAETKVTTKVTPNARSGERGESAAQEAKERHHARHHHMKHHHHAKKMMKTTTTTQTKG